VAAGVTLSEEERTGLKGPAIAERLREKRLAALVDDTPHDKP
jgi:hypothetical protein